MKRSNVVIIWILLAAAISFLAACGQTDATLTETSRPDPPTLSSLTVAQSGNLHFQNLVLAVESQIIFNSDSGLLTLASSDGSDATVLAETGGISPAYDGQQLFYVSGASGGQLSKIRLDGTNQVRIGQTPLKYLISHDNRLYAIESDNGQPVSYKTDGTGRQLISDIQAVALCLADEQLYISGASDQSGLIRLDLASGEQEVLMNRQISSLNVVGKYLYFADPASNFKLTAWSLDNRSGKLISDFSIDKAFIISGGYLYFIDTANQSRLFRLPVDGSQILDKASAELIIDDAVSSFAVTGDYLYYQRPASKRIYRVSTTGGQPLRIA
jgi:outer membrane protein assembly factor BamB